MRFPVTTTSAFSSTESPFIVTIRAPRSTNEPSGAARGTESAIGISSAFGTRTSWSVSFSFSSFSFSVGASAFFASSFFAFSSALRRWSRANSIAPVSGRR